MCCLCIRPNAHDGVDSGVGDWCKSLTNAAAEEFPETELSVAHERQAGKTHLAKRPEPVT